MKAVQRRLPVAMLAAALTLLSLRTWIALDHPLPLGALGDPTTLRSNKLSGWLTASAVPGHWSWAGLAANVCWELLPAVLFAVGLLLWLLRPPPTSHRRLPRLQPALLCCVLFAVASALAWFCFEGIPHVQDAIAQQLQAQIFAAGRAWVPAPLHADRLANEFVIADQGRWYAQYPPVQPALFALGVVVGLPWIVNPLLGAASGYFLYRAARVVYGPLTARLTLLLFCFSPMVWFISAERMNHTGTLFFLSAALWTLAPVLAGRRETQATFRLFGAGLYLGLAASTRTLCGAAAALPLVLGVVLAGRRTPREAFVSGSALAVGMFLGGLPLLAFNAATTGHPLRSGYETRWGNSGWGFGTSQWGPPHTLEAGLRHALANWDAAGKYLLEWPLPTTLLLLGVFLLPRRRRMDGVLAGLLASVTLAYVPYFYQDLCLGPRFLYAALPALLILTARGLQGAAIVLARHHRASLRTGLSQVMSAAAWCATAGLAVNLPILLRWYGNSFWSTNGLLTEAVRRQKLHQAVVFIRDHNHARRVRLTRLGVRWRTAHSAVADLDEEWIDQLLARAKSLPAQAGATLVEEELARAIADPERSHQRGRPVWVDYRGPSSNVSLGFHANTPFPERQDVIYAVSLGPHEDREFLRSYPGRSAWLYDHDPSCKTFVLRPWLKAAPDLP
jgi:hypothetical protein